MSITLFIAGLLAVAAVGFNLLIRFQVKALREHDVVNRDPSSLLTGAGEEHLPFASVSLRQALRNLEAENPQFQAQMHSDTIHAELKALRETLALLEIARTK